MENPCKKFSVNYRNGEKQKGKRQAGRSRKFITSNHMEKDETYQSCLQITSCGLHELGGEELVNPI